MVLWFLALFLFLFLFCFVSFPEAVNQAPDPAYTKLCLELHPHLMTLVKETFSHWGLDSGNWRGLRW